MKSKKITTKTLAYGAILITLYIVLEKILGRDIGAVRISFSFIPAVLGCYLFGPLKGAVLAVVADALGQIVFGGTLPWLGFSVNRALEGFTYGMLFYKIKKNSTKLYFAKRQNKLKTFPLVLVVLFQAFFVDILLGALWFRLYIGMPFGVALITRGIDAVAMIPIKIIVIKYMIKLVGDRIKI